MKASKPETVICTYRVKKGKEAAFKRKLAVHWPTLQKRGLVTREKARHYVGKDREGGTFFVEIFSWKDGSAAGLAHHDPAVMKVWEGMGPLCEERLGRPAMEFPHVEPLALALAKV
ncbi:MAG: hypothetical protein U0166_26005 [Acidobacteriota bacterium]